MDWAKSCKTSRARLSCLSCYLPLLQDQRQKSKEVSGLGISSNKCFSSQAPLGPGHLTKPTKRSVSVPKRRGSALIAVTWSIAARSDSLPTRRARTSPKLSTWKITKGRDASRPSSCPTAVPAIGLPCDVEPLLVSSSQPAGRPLIKSTEIGGVCGGQAAASI